MAKRLTPEDYHALAARRGFTWLGPEVPNANTKTDWRCSQGHEWETTYGKIYIGHGCPVCSNRIPKTPEDYRALAAKRGFEWLGPEVPTVFTKTRWRCPEGHEWQAVYNDINRGRGCPQCRPAAIANKLRLQPSDYRNLAATRGFEWLGPNVPNIQHKTNWRCPNGHLWKARYNDVQQGVNCPTCQDRVNGFLVSKPQRQIAEWVGGDLNFLFGGYALDVVIRPDICIEYDCWYWHKDHLEQDTKRDQALITAGWHVLRIKTGVLMPEKADILSALDRLRNGETYIEIVMPDWGE